MKIKLKKCFELGSVGKLP